MFNDDSMSIDSGNSHRFTSQHSSDQLKQLVNPSIKEKGYGQKKVNFVDTAAMDRKTQLKKIVKNLQGKIAQPDFSQEDLKYDCIQKGLFVS